MKLIVKNRYDAQRSNNCDDPHIIISISTPTMPQADPFINDKSISTLFFEFDDCDRELPFFHGIGKTVLFDTNMANRIIEAIKEYKPKAIIVHCDAGRSRSAGIAAALSKFYNDDDSEYFKGRDMNMVPKYTPNMLVYRVMLNALHGIGTNS